MVDIGLYTLLFTEGVITLIALYGLKISSR